MAQCDRECESCKYSARCAISCEYFRIVARALFIGDYVRMTDGVKGAGAQLPAIHSTGRKIRTKRGTLEKDAATGVESWEKPTQPKN